ncbi:MAG: amidohydrolase family protein [Oscillospiraceae bacterium]|nr:amidohydrolase family protein [Oscillospiraceae bacterium]
MAEKTFALKGIVIHTPERDQFEIHENHYLVCQDETVVGVYETLPPEYTGIPVEDFTDKLIIPGMCDMHIHAPQYAFRGLGLHINYREWTNWFELYAFPDESKYADLEYAEMAYEKLVADWQKTPTTRACIYATIHREATGILMQKLDEAGFVAYVGKVNMDRNSIPGLLETTEESITETLAWLDDCAGRYRTVRPMLTPRYTPTCTDELMAFLGQLANEHNIPIQTHLSEGLNEIEWVKALRPVDSCYGEAYDAYGLFGGTVDAVMAHCVYPTEVEFELMTKRKNLMVAHCPQSNINSSGGVAPIRDYLAAGIRVGLATDMAGSNTLSLFRAITDAVHASKAQWAFTERQGDPNLQCTALSLSDAFYLATKGGGALWGKMGSFEPGYHFDAVIIDDTRLRDFRPRSAQERLERVILTSDDREIYAKYIYGRRVL